MIGLFSTATVVGTAFRRNRMGNWQMAVTPNWQHSKKEAKRKLKPQAMRARREALKALKRKLSVRQGR